MVIKGTKYYNDKNRYYTQINNPEEEMLRKFGLEISQNLSSLGVSEETIKKSKIKSYLETCGPTAAVNCIASLLDKEIEIVCPGPYKPQPEQILADWFNTPSNYPKMKAIRKDVDPNIIMCNRIPQFYPLAIKDVFNINCVFKYIVSIEDIINELKKGNSVQICLKNPGHYVAALATDIDTKDIIINDPWPGRFADNSGFNKIISRNEWNNIQLYCIVYSL